MRGLHNSIIECKILVEVIVYAVSNFSNKGILLLHDNILHIMKTSE